MRPSSQYLDLDLYDYFYYLVRQIPEGMVSTYGDLADALGDRIASRAVGEMLSMATERDNIPAHRVVFADGTVGKQTHRNERTARIGTLRSEGVKIEEDHVPDFENLRFTSFTTDKPLEKIKQEQVRLQSYIEMEGIDPDAQLIAFDVSYSRRNSYAVMVKETRSGYRFSTSVGVSKFPYIPSFLAYREFPAIRGLYHGSGDLLLFDGNGSLHPRKMGLATFAGVLFQSASIGIAKTQTNFSTGKKMLKIRELTEGQRISKNIILSPGNRVTLDAAVAIFQQRFGSAYPEILRVAHNETVKLRRQSLSD